jgi:tetratricopeptide (TPR) repeat protein
MNLITKNLRLSIFLLLCLFSFLFSIETTAQTNTYDATTDINVLLQRAYKKLSVTEFYYATEMHVIYFDSIIKHSKDSFQITEAKIEKAYALLGGGKERDAVAILEALSSEVDSTKKNYHYLLKMAAIAYMRLGERENCVANHSAESCLLPIQGKGIHIKPEGSSKAVELYSKILTQFPYDYEALWMLNIAYMTLGKYPKDIPTKWLIPNLDKDNSRHTLKPFADIGQNIGFTYRNCAGGLVLEDLNNDGYLDIVTSDWNLNAPMHFLLNDTKGSFKDVSSISNVSKVTGGLNMVHADYDNDGDNDIFVLRGAWMDAFGEQANSLLQNNGDGTFTDVTIKSKLLSEHPTETAVWSDFNNDGWLDLFIGNESSRKKRPCELYLSNKNGTFTEVAKLARCNVTGIIKGVNAGDFNNDGFQDIIISGYEGKVLLKNKGVNPNNIPQFENATFTSGLDDLNGQGIMFATWFWDYDNDGWLDIYVNGYGTNNEVAANSAKDALGLETDCTELYLYHNNQDGTFTNVSEKAGLNKNIFPMGSNFGDIDNDGYLDMYLGTGDHLFSSLVPNKLFRNMGDGTFADVTVSARVGNLQKGHGIAIADVDNDGDADIVAEIGGAYVGDAFTNSFYLNPGQNDYNWIKLKLEGVQTNKSAIGSRIKLTFTENGKTRTVYQHVNSGGSFGSSTFIRHIGIGKATVIDEIEITWSGTNMKQVFKNIKPNQTLKIIEGNNKFQIIKLKKLEFPTSTMSHTHCEH